MCSETVDLSLLQMGRVPNAAPFLYDLCAAVVHQGVNTTLGHYIVFIKSKQDAWFKFDNEQVEQVNMKLELCKASVQENLYFWSTRGNNSTCNLDFLTSTRKTVFLK